MGVLFSHRLEVENCKDDDLKQMCGKENCRRLTLLTALGSSEALSALNGMCCDSCTPNALPRELAFVKPESRRRPRIRAVRTVSKLQEQILMDSLEQEREAIVSSSVGYMMLGKELVLPTKCLYELVRKAKYVQTAQDVKVPGLREVFVNRIFVVMMEVIG